MVSAVETAGSMGSPLPKILEKIPVKRMIMMIRSRMRRIQLNMGS
jgi:hypothetical protein